jgi:hypothetical protein
MYEAAIDVIVREGRGSVSLLQRALGIGYGRGARLIDFMAEDGIVGTYNGSQAREVLVTPEQWAQMQAEANGQPAPASVLAPAPLRRNKIEVNPRRPSLLEEADSTPQVPRAAATRASARTTAGDFATDEEAEAQLAAAAKARRTVRPADDDGEAGASAPGGEDDDDEIYGVLSPQVIDDERAKDEDDDEFDEADDEESPTGTATPSRTKWIATRKMSPTRTKKSRPKKTNLTRTKTSTPKSTTKPRKPPSMLLARAPARSTLLFPNVLPAAATAAHRGGNPVSGTALAAGV